ncbi:hypothetical protein CEXT_713461 [Caerostris extrusa]|uniref:Uncharacterized protein n=1 Tax=Caerostris extrusa TaxID=172846 RepID=A0AAV4QII5_CAEEX|nr:hypothetical protein CEXT_713461 [Caerostris extrusa]
MLAYHNVFVTKVVLFESGDEDLELAFRYAVDHVNADTNVLPPESFAGTRRTCRKSMTASPHPKKKWDSGTPGKPFFDKTRFKRNLSSSYDKKVSQKKFSKPHLLSRSKEFVESSFYRHRATIRFFCMKVGFISSSKQKQQD